MPGTPTTYMNLVVPTVGGDSNAWGGYINTDLVAIDTLAVYNIVSVNSSGTLAVFNGPAIIKATGGGGGITTTLPDATVAANKGRTYIIVKVDAGAGAILVNTTGGQTISGVASFSIASQWSRLGVTSDGANWIAINPLEVLTPGTVTSFSSGTLSPVFTTSVSTASTTPALSFTLSNAGSHQFLGNNTGVSAAPSYVQPAFTDLAGTISLAQTPLTTLGDTLFVNVTPALARLAGNTTTQKQYLSQTGTGSLSAPPAWSQISVTDLAEGTTGTGTIVRSVAPSLTGTVAAQNLTLSGTVTNYNSIATVGSGLAPLYRRLDLTAQNTAISSPPALIYTTPGGGSGQYRISWSATVTTPGSSSSSLGGVNGFQVIYTDADTTASVTTPAAGEPTAGQNLADQQLNQLNQVGAQISGDIIVNATAGSNISYTFDYASTGGTAMVYALHIKLTYLG